MKLTGKVKEEFEEWFRSLNQMKPRVPMLFFYELPDSMKYGVYKIFFSEHNIFIREDVTSSSTKYLHSYDVCYGSSIKEGGLHEEIEFSMSLSIEDCGEIFNTLDKTCV